MTYQFPVIELVDRYAIAKLKFAKTGANQAELNFYQEQVKNIDFIKVQNLFDELYLVHQSIWNLESELKSGLEHKLPLEEIGRRAIEIRNFNNRRVELKNIMAASLGCAVQEVKQDHISA